MPRGQRRQSPVVRLPDDDCAHWGVRARDADVDWRSSSAHLLPKTGQTETDYGRSVAVMGRR